MGAKKPVTPGDYKVKPVIAPNHGQSLIHLPNGQWRVNGFYQASTTTPQNLSQPGIGIQVPANIIKKFKLPAGTMITFTPKGSTSTSGAVTPSGGTPLFRGIEMSLPTAAANALKAQWYGNANFNPDAPNASRVLDAVFGQVEVATAKFKGSTDSLSNPTATGAAQVAEIYKVKGVKATVPKPQVVTNWNKVSLAQNEAQFNQNRKDAAAAAAAGKKTSDAQFKASQAQNAAQAAQSNAIAQEGITVGISQATANTQASAFGTVSNYLQTWGLQADASIVHSMIMKAGDHVTDIDALLNAIRGNAVSGMGIAADERLKANYNAAFAGLESYNKSPGAVHMNETQYQTYTAAIMNASTQYGAPQPTQKQIGVLLNGHVSPVEFQQRVTDIYAQVSNADQNVKDLLSKEYGVNQKNLFAYYANPKEALQVMQRQVAGAEIQDYSQRVGLNVLDRAGTNQLADMAKLAATSGNQNLGYGVGQIENSLLTASKDVALTKSAPGANEATVTTKDLIGSQLAGFGGTSQVAAETSVQRAEAAKAAPFEKGGGYAENSKGVTGLGSART